MVLQPPRSGRNADEVQVELLRAASPATRFARARSLSQTVIELARAAIRRRHPELSERDVLLRFVEVHYGSALAAGVRAYLARLDHEHA